MTKHEVAKAIAESGWCVHCDEHREIKCSECPALADGTVCLAKDAGLEGFGGTDTPFANWFKDWLAANPEVTE